MRGRFQKKVILQQKILNFSWFQSIQTRKSKGKVTGIVSQHVCWFNRKKIHVVFFVAQQRVTRLFGWGEGFWPCNSGEDMREPMVIESERRSARWSIFSEYLIWQIQDFYRGAYPWRVTNLLFDQVFFPKTARKWRHFGCISLTPPHPPATPNHPPPSIV